MINSYHHQTIKTLADDLDAMVWSKDGVIEAFEAFNDNHNIVAVQYHPENLVEEYLVHRKLFTDFVERVNKNRQYSEGR